MALSYQQTKLIKDTIPMLREHGERITTTFYRNMLRENPELNNYFNSVNQKNGRQPRALTAVILSYAANINHISELIPKFERMCNKHCSLGIQPEHYEIVGKYLLDAFADVLGPAMTPAVHGAWERAYWLLAKMLIGREAQLYKNFETWNSWRRFKIDRVVPETDDIFSFYMVPIDGGKLPRYFPGQYISLRILGPEGYLQSRQYTLSDAWNEKYYRITVKRDQGSRFTNSVSQSYMNPGVVSNILIDRMPAGSQVELSHPAGEFYFDINNTSYVPLVLISAGVGVTPMVAIANTVTKTQPGRPISWIHGSRGRSVPFDEHVRSLRASNPAFRTKVFRTGTNGLEDGTSGVNGVIHENDSDLAPYDDCFSARVDLSKLDGDSDLFLKHGGTEYYICGPEDFMRETSEYLLSKGVHNTRIKYELFSTGVMSL